MRNYFVLFLLLIPVFGSAQLVRSRAVTLMGSRFDITISAKDSLAAEAYIDSCVLEITRIENLISDWIPDSQVSKINQNAGIRPVKVDPELLELTQRAIGFSELTNGAFDISFAVADKIWKFDGSMKRMPTSEEVKASVARIGYKNIIVNPKDTTIFLKFPGMKIGFGATGKGYAADKTKALMLSKGVEAGIINASGDMATWGKQPNGANWVIGITNPMEEGELLAIFELSGTAVVTSGNYQKYVDLNGKRYSHIIDPRTGYPSSGLASVTVFADSAELANGISTAIMVLGKKKGLRLLKRLSDVQGILVDDTGTIFYSKGFNIKKFES